MNYGLVDSIKLIGSIGLFLYAMKTMSEGLQKIAGGSLRSFLSIVTANKYIGVLSGFLITGIIQSSSVTTVMIVSFVNAGLLSVKQSVGVIMGANIGTTITSWLINGLGFSDIGLLVFALPAIGIGVPIMYSGSPKGKSWGEFLVGFGLLFLGLDAMKNAVPDVTDFGVEFLSHMQHYTESWFSLPLFILIGTIMAIILQSSSTAMGITIVLVSQGWLPMNAAVGLILGENIGTTITAFLASLVANTNAKRTARIHFLFNIFGVIWVLLVLPWFIDIVDYINIHLFGSEHSIDTINIEHRGGAMTGAITLFHSLFNIANTLILINFIPQIVVLSKKLVPSKGKNERGKITSNNLIDIPEMAVMQAGKQLEQLASISSKLIKKYRALQFEEIEMTVSLLKKTQKYKHKADNIQSETVSLLIEISQSNKSERTATILIRMLNICNELKHLTERTYQLCMIEKTCYDEGIEFDKEMKSDLCNLIVEVEKAHLVMEENLANWEKDITPNVAVLHETKINEVCEEIKKKHINRLDVFSQNIKCAIYYRDAYQSLEKSGDYIFNINGYLSGLK